METASKLPGPAQGSPEIGQDLVARITAVLADRFPSFGARREEVGLHRVTPVSAAFADGPPVFALGVSIADVVWTTLRMARENS